MLVTSTSSSLASSSSIIILSMRALCRSSRETAPISASEKKQALRKEGLKEEPLTGWWQRHWGNDKKVMSEKVEGDKYFSNMSLADLQHGLSDLISTPHNFSSLFFLFSQICSKLFSYKAVQYGSDLDGAVWICPSLHCKIMPLRHLLHLVHDSMSWLICA